jgi:hypothetical protein
MTITEIRNCLAAEQRSSGNGEFPQMPDWAVRHIYERRTGRALTKFPAGMRVLNATELHSFVNQRPVQAVVEGLATASEREVMQRRLQIASLSLLQ